MFSRPSLFRAQNVPLSEAESSALTKSIYVVGHGWHTGLVIEREHISPDLWPESTHFFDKKYVEVGWGDEGFYRARKITPQLIFKAAMVPTPSVLHVIGFNAPVERYYPVNDIARVELSPDGFEQLCRFIHRTYAHDDEGEAIWLGPGIYGTSYFYRPKGKYYFPKTCNIWTARALRAAGCPIVPELAATAENVILQTRLFGRIIRKSPPFVLKHAALSAGD